MVNCDSLAVNHIKKFESFNGILVGVDIIKPRYTYNAYTILAKVTTCREIFMVLPHFVKVPLSTSNEAQ